MSSFRSSYKNFEQVPSEIFDKSSVFQGLKLNITSSPGQMTPFKQDKTSSSSQAQLLEDSKFQKTGQRFYIPEPYGQKNLSPFRNEPSSIRTPAFNNTFEVNSKKSTLKQNHLNMMNDQQYAKTPRKQSVFKQFQEKEFTNRPIPITNKNVQMTNQIMVKKKSLLQPLLKRNVQKQTKVYTPLLVNLLKKQRKVTNQLLNLDDSIETIHLDDSIEIIHQDNRYSTTTDISTQEEDHRCSF